MAISFACSKCGNVDIDTSPERDQGECYACRTGEWHGMFEQEAFDSSIHDVHNRTSDSEDDDLGSPSMG